MEVSVERYQRKKYVNQENSPVLYYIRQKAGTAKVVDIDALAEDIQTNCALTTGDVKHTIEALVTENIYFNWIYFFNKTPCYPVSSVAKP